MDEDLIASIQKLIDSGKGDIRRLNVILETIKNGKPLFSFDQKYLDSLLDSMSDLSQDSLVNSNNDKKDAEPLSILENKIQENDSIEPIKNSKNIKNRFWSKTKIIATIVPFLMIVVLMISFSNIPEQLEKEINSLTEHSQNSGKLHTIYSNFGVETGDWIKYQVLDTSDESVQYTVLVLGASDTYATVEDEGLRSIGADSLVKLMRTNDPIDFRYFIPIDVKVGDVISLGETGSMKVDGIQTIQISGVNVRAFETSLSGTHSVNDGWVKVDMHNFYDKTTGMLLSTTVTALTNDGHSRTFDVYAIDASDHILYPKMP